MPAIIVNDYTWRQTPEAIIISTQLSGHPRNVDLFAIDNYIKASYPPFILELFLWEAILEEESECTVDEKSAVFTLKKAEMGLEWPTLVTENLDKDTKRARRCRAFELARLSAEKLAKSRSEKRQTLQKRAVRAQIELDTTTLNKIEAVRDSHRKEAMKELEDWRNRAEKPIFEDVVGAIQENKKAYRAPLKWFNEEEEAVLTQAKFKESGPEDKTVVISKEPQEENAAYKNNLQEEGFRVSPESSIDHSNGPSGISSDKNFTALLNVTSKEKPERLLSARKYRDSSRDVESSSSSLDSSDLDTDSESKICPMKATNRGKQLAKRLPNGKIGCVGGRGGGKIFDEPDVSLPRPRRCGTINVQFSERPFPTPARESHRLEEQQWLEKQAEARRKSGFVSEDLRAEEQDPQWLKDKGDEFFKAGNYLASISAYTHGMKLSEKMSSLYANRSAAHYAAGNYRRCAEDCSTALKLIVPKCEGNRDSRARCHARLGAALCKLSAPQHGIPELEAALALAPQNDTIKRDLQVAKGYFQVKD